MSRDRFVVTRTIAAPAAEVFAVLADPARHKDTEPGDWVRDAVTTEPITRTGQMFAMNMFLEQFGPYVTHNLVTDYEKDRAIEWLPGRLDADGSHGAGGWTWRYDLTANGVATDVTLTYDWTDTPQVLRDKIGGMPPFPEEFLVDSLASLDRAVTGA